MTTDTYVEQFYHVQCRGRDRKGEEVLTEPIKVAVEIYKSPNSNTISSKVNCPYNTGGHRQRCKASHPDVDKKWGGIICPYSFDIPHALEKKEVIL